MPLPYAHREIRGLDHYDVLGVDPQLPLNIYALLRAAYRVLGLTLRQYMHPGQRQYPYTYRQAQLMLSFLEGTDDSPLRNDPDGIALYFHQQTPGRFGPSWNPQGRDPIGQLYGPGHHALLLPPHRPPFRLARLRYLAFENMDYPLARRSVVFASVTLDQDRGNMIVIGYLDVYRVFACVVVPVDTTGLHNYYHCPLVGRTLRWDDLVQEHYCLLGRFYRATEYTLVNFLHALEYDYNILDIDLPERPDSPTYRS
jgi:hypothetical protein